MSYLLPCDCPAPESLCTLEEAIKDILAVTPGLGLLTIFTGGKATLGDTGNTDLQMPFMILSELGVNNSQRVGESWTRHEVVVQFRIQSSSDQQGVQLMLLALEALRDASPIETINGYSCRNRVPARARPVKLDSGRWLTQANQTFFVFER